MKISYTHETGENTFIVRSLETNKLIKVGNEFIGKNDCDYPIHINIDNVIKIEEVEGTTNQTLTKDIEILRAIELLNENDYVVKKLTAQQEKDLDECNSLEGDKDCMGCSCSGCMFD